MGNLVADVRAGVQDHHGLQMRDGVREQVRDQVSRAKIQNISARPSEQKYKIQNTSAKWLGQIYKIQMQDQVSKNTTYKKVAGANIRNISARPSERKYKIQNTKWLGQKIQNTSARKSE